MMDIYRLLRIQLFEWRYQRLLGIIPLFVFCTSLLVIVRDSSELHLNIQIVHSLYLPWISWSVILYFQPLYDTGAYYTLIPHYRKWISLKFVFLFTFYVMGYLLLLFNIDGAFRLLQTNPLILVHHLLLLTLFWWLGAALVLLLKSFEYAIALVLTYTLIEVITRGEFMPWPHIFYFHEYYDLTIYIQKISLIVFISLVFVCLALVRLYKRD